MEFLLSESFFNPKIQLFHKIKEEKLENNATEYLYEDDFENTLRVYDYELVPNSEYTQLKSTTLKDAIKESKEIYIKKFIKIIDSSVLFKTGKDLSTYAIVYNKQKDEYRSEKIEIPFLVINADIRIYFEKYLIKYLKNNSKFYYLGKVYGRDVFLRKDFYNKYKENLSIIDISKKYIMVLFDFPGLSNGGSKICCSAPNTESNLNLFKTSAIQTLKTIKNFYTSKKKNLERAEKTFKEAENLFNQLTPEEKLLIELDDA